MYANPRKTKSVRHLGDIDISGIREDILNIPESIWDRENADKPNKIRVLGETKHIIFRFVKSFGDWRDVVENPLWAIWRNRIEPVLQQATAAYGYKNSDFPRVMLARMAPGGIIDPHRDIMPAATWPHKIHVPILTNEQVKFFIEPETYYFPEGKAVEVNNLDTHAVRNEGSTDRIHLIFEYFDKDQPSWLDQSA